MLPQSRNRSSKYQSTSVLHQTICPVIETLLRQRNLFPNRLYQRYNFTTLYTYKLSTIFYKRIKSSLCSFIQHLLSKGQRILYYAFFFYSIQQFKRKPVPPSSISHINLVCLLYRKLFSYTPHVSETLQILQ